MKILKGNYSMLKDKKIFWDKNFEIHNEYYPDDNVNFFHNHRREFRNIANAVGCYYG
jgi:hypothetical protein